MLKPPALRAGGAGFTLGVSGRNFTPGTEALIGGKTRRTILINNTELQMAVEAEPGLIGVDQLNLGPLLRTLDARGTVNLVVTVDGKPANTVQLTIK